MKTMITALLAATAMAAAVPAMAQDYDDRGRGRGSDDRGYDDRRYGDRGYDDRYDDRRGGYGDLSAGYARIDNRIQRGMRSGAISYREADRLRQKLRELRMLDRRYRATEGRLTRWERQDLMRRTDQLERQVRLERRDRDDRRY